MKHFIHFNDLSTNEIYKVLDRADELHQLWHDNRMPQALKDQKIALWSFGNGFRNRLAFEIGAKAMGAHVSYVPGELGVHEPLNDIMHYLNNWFTLLSIRCKNYDDLISISKDSKMPIINARTNLNHPAEILGDLQYIRRKRKTIENLKVAFIGEVTNLCMSWFEASKVLPIDVIQISPKEYLYPETEVTKHNSSSIGKIETSDTLYENIDDSIDVLYTDCWPKMENAKELFLPYQIDKKLISRMKPDSFFMPCPPITIGEELSADSIETDQYCDYEAKEFLLHSQNALMEYIIK